MGKPLLCCGTGREASRRLLRTRDEGRSDWAGTIPTASILPRLAFASTQPGPAAATISCSGPKNARYLGQMHQAPRARIHRWIVADLEYPRLDIISKSPGAWSQHATDHKTTLKRALDRGRLVASRSQCSNCKLEHDNRSNMHPNT